MDFSILEMLLAIGGIMALVSVSCSIAGKENVITLLCMLFSGFIYWACSNELIGGTLTKVNEVTGVAEVIQDSITSKILFYIAVIMLVGFCLEVYKVIVESGIGQEPEEFGE